MHKSIAAAFTDKLVAKTRAIRLGDPLDEETHVGAMISPTQAQKVLNYIDSARKEVRWKS